jgi:PHD/YefM family antitoxin component YafN of YafNO toxin-antitoxin module
VQIVIQQIQLTQTETAFLQSLIAKAATAFSADEQPLLAFPVEEGKSLVLLDESQYQKLQDELEYVEVRQAIEEGRRDKAAGRTHSVSEVFAEINAKYGFPPREKA